MKLCGLDFYRMTLSGAARLAQNEGAVNSMNVFPVPDGDTGSNMKLTLSTLSTLSTLGEQEMTLGDYAEKVASLALRAARGNSGAILSLFFRGMAKAFRDTDTADAALLAGAFDLGVKEAYRAVATPTEGTILTVMRRTAEAALLVCDSYRDDPVGMMAHLVTVADSELARTPEILPILREAKVVDAGGYGFLLILEGMLAYLRGDAAVYESEAPREKAADFSEFDENYLTFTYCTECIVDKDEAHRGEGSAEALRRMLTSLGDSLVFLDDEAFIKLHIHTDHPGKVLEEAIVFGALSTVKIENMRIQHSEQVSIGVAKTLPTTPSRPFSFVAVCMGEGVADTFRELGVDSVVYGGQTMNPSTEELLSAIEKSEGKTVYLFPNNKNILLVASEAARMTKSRQVTVVPTRNIAEGIAALLAFDEGILPEENLAYMSEAIKRVTCISITHAVRDCNIGGLSITSGQLIGLVNEKIAAHGDSHEACIACLREQFTDAASVTLFYGDAVDEDSLARVCRTLEGILPDDVELVTISGKQGVYDYIISVE